MNDFLPIILSILAALVVVGGLVPVLMKARKTGAKYPGTRDANDPVQSPAAGGGTLVEDRPDAVTAPAPPTFDGTVEDTDVPDDAAGLETIAIDTPAPVEGRLTRLRARLIKSNNILGKGSWLCCRATRSMKTSGTRWRRPSSWPILAPNPPCSWSMHCVSASRCWHAQPRGRQGNAP